VSLKANVALSVKGRYKAIVHKGDGVPIRESGWSKNVLTDGGVDYLFTQTGDFRFNPIYFHCVVGTGSSTPSVSDNSLDNYTGKYDLWHAHSLNRQYSTSPYYYRRTMTARFLPGTLTNSSINLAEVGMVFTRNNTGDYTNINGSTPIHSRALFLDSGGNPVTVTVLSDEYLDVIWEWTWYVMDEYLSTVTIDIDGLPTVFDIEVWPANMSQGSGGSSAGVGSDYTYGWGDVNGKMFTAGAEGSSRGQCGWHPPHIVTVGRWGSGARGLSGVMSATITGQGDLPTPSTTVFTPDNITLGAYTPGDHNRNYTLSWGIAGGNVPGGISVINLMGLFGHWQIGLDPVLNKTDIQTMELTFNVAIDNTP